MWCRESLTAAIAEALRERLGRLRRRDPRASLAECLRAIGEGCAPRPKEPFRSAPHSALLYDGKGVTAMIIDSSALLITD